ncbi:secretin N-terminal domain-containing protein [Paraglaciecola sp.]|uniref:secretin N-terminal domain-containing protein n=1 Tax=Paraglaciecola sp. TaxID=1920173 RepID=UPI003EF52C85
MQKLSNLLSTTIILIVAGSCSSMQEHQYQLERSYLKQAEGTTESKVEGAAKQTLKVNDSFKVLPQMSIRETAPKITSGFSSQFSADEYVEIVSNDLSLEDFLHYVFGEILTLNYIVGDSAKNASQTVTLNIQQKISKQKLFALTQELLAEKGFMIRQSEGVFYVNNEESSQGRTAMSFGYGRGAESVPNTSAEIMQMVPFKYGLRSNLNLILPSIASVKVIPDREQNSAMLLGRRDEILKALEFIDLVDAPAYRTQKISSFKSTFVPAKELAIQLKELLKNDGYVGGLSSVVLDNQASLVLFSSDGDLMSRAKFWLEQLDVPADTEEKQYFVFQPKYARATDLTESLAPLLGSVTNGSMLGQGRNNSNARDSERSDSTNVKMAGNEKVSIVVDERSNSLIVNASGKDYRSLLPLIERLDVLPKQVMLEVMIAEVTLTDQFKQGVEFFLTENNFTLGDLGSLGQGAIGGLSYVLTGSRRFDVKASLSQKNTLVNIISRPSLLVRDGVTASMKVGTSIPISSSIVTDIGTTSSVQYRRTGLSLSVTPTVNSRGVVIMEIEQEVSNALDLEDGVSSAGAPSIFDRSMKTEVVANSGQTIVLGGLISENRSDTLNEVPGLGGIPLLGNLFKGKDNRKDKTELVVMVTPRIIESSAQWNDIKTSMAEQLEQIQLSENVNKP